MYIIMCSPVELAASKCGKNESSLVCLWLALCRRSYSVPWANLALFTISADLSASADLRSSVSVRLLGLAVGVLDANEPRGKRDQRHQPLREHYILLLSLANILRSPQKVSPYSEPEREYFFINLRKNQASLAN